MKHTQTIQIAGLSALFLGVFFIVSFTQGTGSSGEDAGGVTIKENYFAGKTIEWVTPFKEGGGGDTWARFNAPFLAKYLPGHPTVIISNIPGGGSIKGSNLFAERVKPDGFGKRVRLAKAPAG